MPRQMRRAKKVQAKRPRQQSGQKLARNESSKWPTWLNWEYLAAFGEDDTGYTYLEAMKQFCSKPNREMRWVQALVHRAQLAHDRVGRGDAAQDAALRVLRQAGMILLSDEKRPVFGAQPRAAFFCPSIGLTVVIAINWTASILDD